MIAQAAAQGVFTAPEVEWSALTPLLIVFGAGVVGVLIEAFAPARLRRPIQIYLTLVALVAAFCVMVWQGVTWLGEGGPGGVSVLGGVVVIEGISLLFQGTIVIAAFLAMLVVIDRTSANQDAFAPSAASIPGSDYEELARRQGVEQTEIYPLMMFAIGGMLIFPIAADLLTMFVALEVLSLPLYVLSGMARRRRLLSQEASFKYFVLGAFSSAIFLFGAALLYGFSGSVRLTEIATRTAAVGEYVSAGATSGDVGNWDLLWLVGILMVLVGLLFKVGAVPFQAWAPDVYQGAPTPITGFMAACTKIAAFGAIIRIIWFSGFLNGSESMTTAVKTALWVVAIATMIVGAIVGATQTDMKRMLGYSSIAHAGFVLVAILSFNTDGIKATIFYLFAYGLATVGAFGVVTMVRETGRGGEVLGEATHLGQWAGLGKRSPWLAACFSLFLLSFAGIPLTAGFIGKFTAFSAAIKGGVLGDGAILAVVGVLASAIAVFFYIRVIVIMFFTSPADETTDLAGTDVAVGAGPGAWPGATDTLAQTVNAAQTSVLVAQGAPTVTVVRSQGPTAVTVAITAIAVVVIGVFPAPVLDLIARATGL
jgi:NADH-quinone oxidoreductase subunit N